MLNISLHTLFTTGYERGWAAWLDVNGVAMLESALIFRMNQHVYHYTERTTDTECKTTFVLRPVNLTLFKKFIAK